MRKLLLVTKTQTNFSDIVPAIEKEGFTLSWADSGHEALEAIGEQAIQVVIADENLIDMTGLTLVEKIVAVNPMINCALVSSLSKKEYHDTSEGLGILMRLPPNPKKTDGEKLMSHLQQILGFISKTNK